MQTDTRVKKGQEASGTPPMVAIVGRPNVGKSTFFNRLVGRRKAIVDRQEGTTRDAIDSFMRWKDKTFTLVDTGGIRFSGPATLEAVVEAQVRRVIEKADLILWVVDVRSGPLPLDERLADLLRRSNKKTLLVANKADDGARVYEMPNFYRLGFRDIFAVSALHGHGASEVLDRVAEELPQQRGGSPREFLFSVAIVGGPNTGKSTYLNRILGEERVLVSELPGTTRDSVETLFSWHGDNIRLCDTAGLRRRRHTQEAAGFFSSVRTQEAIRRADVVLLFFEAQAGFGKNAKVIFQLVRDEGKGCVLVANKCDLVKTTREGYEEELKGRVPYLADACFEFVSSLEGKNIEGPLERAHVLWRASRKRIATKELNRFLDRLLREKAPPPSVKLKFMVQHGVQPPSFALFVKRKHRLPEDYLMFFRNRLVRHFHFEGVPIRLTMKEATAGVRRSGR